MKKEKRVPVRQSDQSWFIKMLFLMVFIVGMLVLGEQGNRQLKEAPGAVQGRGVSWWPTKDEWAVRLGVKSKDPWALTRADLTRARLVFNILTKPGYRTLILQGFLMMMGVVTMVKGVEYAYLWQRKQMMRAIRLAREVSRRGVVVEIAGSVRIGAERGVIYVSTLEAGQEITGEPYLISLSWLPVRVVRA